MLKRANHLQILKNLVGSLVSVLYRIIRRIKMSYDKMIEISAIAKKQGIELKTIADFVKFTKELDNEK